jgi:integrase/recombinase XerD
MLYDQDKSFVLALCYRSDCQLFARQGTAWVMGRPVVTIFVRHSSDCAYKGDEFSKRCHCNKHVRWSVNGRQYRRSAKARSWTEAEAAKRKVEQQFDPPSEPITSTEHKTIEQAVELFLDFKTAEGLDPGVLKKYERELERLRVFMDRRMAFHVTNISLEHLTKYRAAWTEQYPSSTTRQKVQERLKAFLGYCYQARWLDRVPKLSSIQVDAPPTMPLTDKEYERLLAQCSKQFEPQKANKIHAFIQCMRHSGLAIRDAVPLQRDEIQWDKKKKIHRIVTNRQKTGVHVSVPLPPEIAKELLAIGNGNGKYVFWNRGALGGHESEGRGREGKETTAVTSMQTDLRNLFKAADLYLNDQHMVSHRLRDTFAVAMLNNDIPLQDVAKMLGNSVKVCEKHYAQWVQSRQDKLDTLVVATFKK